ncbi:MAG TPA: ATPase, partial [Firmicutes bacterium]|nr:ATPase [Bacillota bacterium]
MKKESETLELKKSLAQLKEGIISLSSMLNKHHKGCVIFGINDDGKVCGIDIGKKTINDITHEIQNSLKPLPLKVDINPFVEAEKKLIKVEVEGDDTPYSAYGRYYIRINDSDITMDSNQLQKFFEDKQETYLKWEQTETEYGVEDVNEEILIDCIRTANEKGRMDYVYRNTKEALNKLGLLTENDKLNNAGLYLFGNNKPLTIKEACFPTDSRTEFGEIKLFSGNIFECIRESIYYIQNHISYKSRIVGIQREEEPEIPLRAIREIVVNSFAHCSYARVGDYNQYTIYKSSVRIYNPGSIIMGLDPINFASGKVGSKIRNLLIASTLYKYGYIDAFGTGFDRTFTLCSQKNVNYKYYEDDFGFTFVFKRNKDFLNDKINDK